MKMNSGVRDVKSNILDSSRSASSVAGVLKKDRSFAVREEWQHSEAPSMKPSLKKSEVSVS